MAQAGKKLLCVLLLALLWGCGGESYQYSDSREMKPGPGLLSGEDGVFTLYSKEKVSSPAGDEEDRSGQKTEETGAPSSK